MRILTTLLIAAALIGPALAEDEMSWEAKREILLRAYRANGNSMTRWGAIDIKEIVDGQLIMPRDVTPVKPAIEGSSTIQKRQ